VVPVALRGGAGAAVRDGAREAGPRSPLEQGGVGAAGHEEPGRAAGMSLPGMTGSTQAPVGAGCLAATAGAAVGLGVWARGARPGLQGAFEGQRDWSLLYGDLPVMLLGFPAVTLAVWALTYASLRGRARRRTVALASGAAVVLTLAALAWTGTAWLDARVAWVAPSGAQGHLSGATGA
jgi:hypothetical protein